MIDENPTHRLSGDREEVDAIPIRDGLAPDQAKAELIHHGVGFERMIAALPLQEVRGDLAQVRMDRGEDLVARARIPLPPLREPARDLRRR